MPIPYFLLAIIFAITLWFLIAYGFPRFFLAISRIFFSDYKDRKRIQHILRRNKFLNKRVRLLL